MILRTTIQLQDKKLELQHNNCMKYFHSFLLIFISFHLFSDEKPYFSEQKFLKCAFAIEEGVVTSYHYLYAYPKSSTDNHYTFATLKTNKNFIYEETGKNIPYVFYEIGNPKNLKKEFDREYQREKAYVYYGGDSDEVLRLKFSFSSYVHIRELEINRYSLLTIDYLGGCVVIKREVFVDELSNFRQLREETLNELQRDFAL